jgi:hypothetical protein
MIGGSGNIYKHDVLSQFSEEDIFFLAGLEYTDKVICNPFRNDSTPKCSFRFYNNTLYFCDGTGYFGKTCINCFDLLSFTTKIPIGPELYKYILTNCKRLSKQSNIIKTSRIKINFTPRAWDKEDYFIIHGFDADYLQEKWVYPVAKYEFNTHKEPNIIRTNAWGDPKYSRCYAYLYPSGNVKLYWPYRKSNKFYTNCVRTDISGSPFVGERLWVTKSHKDYLFLDYYCNYEVTATITEAVILEFNGEYNEVIYLYDSDKAGIKASMKAQEAGYDTRTILIDKDPFDLYLNNGLEYAQNYFKWLNT